MSARNNARHVRQRKLNTKQGLRVVRESEIEDGADDEAQRNIPQVETGVEKGEEVEVHLQAVISAANAAALGALTQQSFIPTPETVKAKGLNYDELYPRVFSQPATYVRFSATVEESIGVAYCINDEDSAFLAKLNDGKDFEGRDRKDKLNQCSVENFEDVMTLFEEASARNQPFVAIDSPPILSLEEIEQSNEEHLSADARLWLKPIYAYWVVRKTGRARMPTIKVRVLDTSSEADDADPYICFRRREVRQTRKTRGRDAQVVDKLKKLRMELEQARKLVQLVVQRERLNKDGLETSRKLFEERRRLKEVKVTKNIIGEKGDDEELLVNQKPVAKPKRQSDATQIRPSTIRIRSSGERTAPDTDLDLLSDRLAEAEAYVNNNIETRKEQHKKWNHHWIDRTWTPLTPPPEEAEHSSRWGSLQSGTIGYPTPPPSIPSISRETSQTKDADVQMTDLPLSSQVENSENVAHPFVGQARNPQAFPKTPTPATSFYIFQIPQDRPIESDEHGRRAMRDANAPCRMRYGRGGRCFLEARARKSPGHMSRGVVSDSESETEDDMPEYFSMSERITFDYRCALNSRSRTDTSNPERRTLMSGDTAAGQLNRTTAGSSIG